MFCGYDPHIDELVAKVVIGEIDNRDLNDGLTYTPIGKIQDEYEQRLREFLKKDKK